MNINEITEKIIGCAIEVHRYLGPGLLESAYEECLDLVVVELKTADAFVPVHEAQILTHMKFAEKNIGLLINFNVILLKNGIKRYKR